MNPTSTYAGRLHQWHPDALPSLPTAEPASRPATTTSLAQRIGAGLRRWWQIQRLDERSRYLAQASTAADLEQRMRDWDDQRARDAWMTLQSRP